MRISVYRVYMFLLVVLLGVILLTSSCDLFSNTSTDSDEPTPEEVAPDEAVFWAIDTTKNYSSDDSAWYQVYAAKKGIGTHCIIYVQNEQVVSDQQVNTIITEFDDAIWPVLATNFGTPIDRDNNGKVILLLMDILDSYNPDAGISTYIGGYFFPVDLYTNVELNTGGYPDVYRSNEAELLYIDTSPSNPGSPNILSTITHEFQHLVQTSTNVFSEGAASFPTWINEGFSMAAEALYQGTDFLEPRTDWYARDPLITDGDGIPNEPGKSIAYGYPLVLWNPYSSSEYSVLNDYALSHLFFAWMEYQAGGAGIYKNIMDSADNTEAIVVTTFNNNTSNAFDAGQLLETWYLANLFTGYGKTDGLLSYGPSPPYTQPEGPIEITYNAGDTFGLHPSGAMYLINSSAINEWSPSGGASDIEYVLADTSLYEFDNSAPYGTSNVNHEVLIVYNRSMTINWQDTPPESAPLPSTQITEDSQTLEESSIESLKAVNTKQPPARGIPKDGFRIGLEPKGRDLEVPNQVTLP